MIVGFQGSLMSTSPNTEWPYLSTVASGINMMDVDEQQYRNPTKNIGYPSLNETNLDSPKSVISSMTKGFGHTSFGNVSWLK